VELNKLQQRLSIKIKGAIQGVGFRPFIYRLATELELTGWVSNSGQGVLLEVEGTSDRIDIFQHRLQTENPPQSRISHIVSSRLTPLNDKEFIIRPSATNLDGQDYLHMSTIVSPDLATCNDCRDEIFNPKNRRYRYPFTNCTNCGPRYSIIEKIPYDRHHTAMRNFPLCPECQTEYTDPSNRRFHAQPNACPICGPQLALWNWDGQVIAQGDRALLAAAAQITQGKILAVKGLGGFHLMVDARSSNGVQQLRQRKQRPHQPFALMYPSLAQIQSDCVVSELAANLLQSAAAPIVLLPKKSQSIIPCTDVAPGNPNLGVMLPYSPLHHLLMAALQFPIVATSGNLASEPICIDEREALEHLGQIADSFLVHNRPILRPVDDSVLRVMVAGDSQYYPLILRRARGYAPLPIMADSRKPLVSNVSPHRILALGGHLKNTIALGFDHQIILSQHIGDLKTVAAFENFQRAISSLSDIYGFQPTAIACDAHSDYHSSQFAQQLGQQLAIPVIPIQHHYAHVLACMVDNQVASPVLGVAWDGTGYGLDGTIWGGEFLLVTAESWERVAHLRPFPLPGGEQAIKQPRRAAVGLLWEIFGEQLHARSDLKTIQAFSPQEFKAIEVMLSKQLNTPLTSSVGRLFDVVASLLDLYRQTSFEGQAAMALESMIFDRSNIDEYYEFDPLAKVIDWSLPIQGILQDLEQQLPHSQIVAKFHNTLVEIIVAVAQQIGVRKIALTGGCFQNKYLTERSIQRLKQEGFDPFWHQYIPPNDGGLAVGQAIAALSQLGVKIKNA
jgi:hydrogenase maturation protein HypF